MASRRGLMMATVLALLLHAAALLGWVGVRLPARAGDELGVLTTRLIAAAPTTPAATPAPPPQETPPPPPKPAPKPKPAPQPAPDPQPQQPRDSQDSDSQASPQPQARGAAQGEDSPITSLLQTATGAQFGGGATPTPTRPSLEGAAANAALAVAQEGEQHPGVVPRGATVRYQVSGQIGGTALNVQSTLSWRRADDFYEAAWTALAPVMRHWRWTADGLIVDNRALLPARVREHDAHTAISAAHINPLLHLDYAARQVHFEVPAPVSPASVSSSAPAEAGDGDAGQSAVPDAPASAAEADTRSAAGAYPLPSGTLDALSAIVQLGAWVAGDSQRLAEGQSFSLPILSSQGVHAWSWQVEPGEDLTALAGQATGQQVRAIHFSHIPGPDAPAGSPQLDVWLAPALDYLPVRLRLQWPNGDVADHLAHSARLNQSPDAP